MLKFKRINQMNDNQDLIIILAMTVILLILAIFVVVNFGLVPKVKISSNKAVAILTDQLEKETSKYQRAADAKKPKLQAKMLEIAKQRKQEMASLIKENPAQALALAIPKEKRDSLPAQVQENIEEEVTLTGNLQVSHIDDFENKKEIPYNTLTTETEQFFIYPTEPLPAELSGTKVEVSGIVLGQNIATDVNHTIEVITPSVLGVQTTTGALRVAVLRAKFQGEPCFADNRIRTNVFTNLNNYIRQASYGKAWITGDLFDCIPVPFNRSDFSMTGQDLIKAADPLVYFPNYSHVFLIYNRGGFAGGFAEHFTDDGRSGFAVASIGDGQGFHTAAHEMGHNLGRMGHANFLKCGPNDALNFFLPNCNFGSIEYGDPYDQMGGGPGITGSGHYNAYHKERIGWLDPSNIIEVTAPGDYTIETFETVGSGPKIIKVPRGWYTQGTSRVFEWFYVENRQGVGPIIYWAKKRIGGGDTQLLGQLGSFRDYILDIRVSVVSQTATSLTVRVEAASLAAIPRCSRDQPLVDVTPVISTGKRGQTLAYQVSVTNRDINRGDCPNTTFSLLTQLFGGWLSSLPASLTLAAGETRTVTWNLTSAGDAFPGIYFPLVSVRNADEPNPDNNNFIETEYIVEAGHVSDASAPTAPSNLRATSLTANSVSLAWDASTDNIGVAGYKILRSANGPPTEMTLTNNRNVTIVRGGVSYEIKPNVSSNFLSIEVKNLATGQKVTKFLKPGESALAVGLDVYLESGFYRQSTLDGTAKVLIGAKAFSQATNSYTDTGVSAGNTYYYQITANDAVNNFSGFSNQLTVVPVGGQVPTPTLTPTPTIIPTQTPTPTPIPTPTPSPIILPSPSPSPSPIADLDGDGCTNTQELGPNEALGGRRDPNNAYDFFDVPLPAGNPGTGTKNKVIDVSDILGVILKYGTHNNGTPTNFSDDIPNSSGQKYNPDFDRSFLGPDPWDLGAGDGVINAFDINLIAQQFGHTCL